MKVKLAVHSQHFHRDGITVTATPVKVSGLEMALHHSIEDDEPEAYTVSDPVTGARLASGPTIAQALRNARAQLRRAAAYYRLDHPGELISAIREAFRFATL